MPFTPSEALVAELCQRSFLSLWSTANPLGRQAKELCDAIVVCGRDVVLFSVKEIAFKETSNVEVDGDRWRRKAVDASGHQLYGAERVLANSTRITHADGSPGIELPALPERRVHRVAVALGSRGQVPYHQGDLGKGFVHVFDEQALLTVMRELDTVTDFVHYLANKQALLERGTRVLIQGQEEDLLAFYIHQGRKFPDSVDMLIVGDDLWSGLTQKPEWKARKELDRESYVWDGLIETLTGLNAPTGADPMVARDELETSLRIMALETRLSRRMLAGAFNDFMRDAAARKTRARSVLSLSNVQYVFLAVARDEDREDRKRELGLRCFVARGLLQSSRGDTVIGIATEQYAPGQGFSLDVCYLKKPSWTADDREAMRGIQRDLGYFSNPRRSKASGDEFPHLASVQPVGRNDSCPCGSGRKYKKCHGAPTR